MTPLSWKINIAMAKKEVYVASRSGDNPQHRKIAIPGKEQTISTYRYQ
jgi:hypothetical protein